MQGELSDNALDRTARHRLNKRFRPSHNIAPRRNIEDSRTDSWIYSSRDVAPW